MEMEILNMSQKEVKRYKVITDLIERRITKAEAGQKLELSKSQIKRIKRRLLKDGARGVIHGLRGKTSNHHLDPEKRKLILDLWNSKYSQCNFNFSHFTQMLLEVEKINVSRETVRRILRAEGLANYRPKRRREFRKCRDRRECFGELLQQDTSPHDWFGTGEKQQMIAIIDDATGKILFAQLFCHDGSLSNMSALKVVFEKYGLPQSIYVDKASWFFYSRKTNSLLNQTLGFEDTKKHETQIQKALEELGVELIPAHSPQAKGRIERLNGTMQDRLIAELKLHAITTIAAANEYLITKFIPDFNQRFNVEPKSKESAFVTMTNPEILDQILCLKYTHKVLNDNVVAKKDIYKLQLLPTPKRQNWAQARVMVRVHTDLRIEVTHFDTGEWIPFKILNFKFDKEHKYTTQIPKAA